MPKSRHDSRPGPKRGKRRMFVPRVPRFPRFPPFRPDYINLKLNQISKSSNKSHLFWQNKFEQNKFEQIEISLTTQDNFGRLIKSANNRKTRFAQVEQ